MVVLYSDPRPLFQYLTKVCSAVVTAVMDDAGTSSSSQRRPSSSHSSGKRSRKDVDHREGENKRRKEVENVPEPERASPQSVVGQSGSREDVNIAAASVSQPSTELGQLTALLSTVIKKLDNNAQANPSQGSFSGFSGVHVLSSSEEEEGEIPQDAAATSRSDPLDGLDNLCSPPASSPPVDDDDAFLKALGELSAHFHGEEEKGEPLSDRLATILNDSLRRCPSSEAIKHTCAKIRLPSNVPNLCVPSTNTAITKALSTGGKILDTRLFHTTGLLNKALVPIAQFVSDIGEKAGKPPGHYLEGFNNSIRLLVSAVNFLNHMRKEVARLHVHDSALTDLCKWECEVGKDTLFPFDVAKKCDEIHKTRRLGRPTFRPYRSGGSRKFVPANRAASRRSFFQRAETRSSRPFLGQMTPQGRGIRHRTSH